MCKLSKTANRLHYDACILEALNINKEYLQKLSLQHNVEFIEAKIITNDFLNELQKGITISPSVKDKFANILTCINIKSKLSFLNDELMQKLHDGILHNSNLVYIILQNTNSDTEPEQFTNILNTQVSKAKSTYKLPAADIAIWERVKVYKDFGKYRWVYAVDEAGNVVSYMPSRITSVVMNHCGNEPSKQPGDEYWELRDESNHAYLTVIINDGLIQEAKSFGNQSSHYTKEIYKYVEWFYKSDIVKGVGHRYDYGYGVDKNFGVTTIAVVDPEFITWCKENKPALLGVTEKIILKYRKYSIDKLTDMYIDNPCSFGYNNWAVYLAAVGGKENLPLSEDDIIHKLIEPMKVPLKCFINADVDLVTPRIQRAYIKYYGINALATLFYIAKNVNSFNVDRGIVQFLHTKNPSKTNLLIYSLPVHKQKLYADLIG